MNSTISMDEAGRLVLPKAIRERYKLSGGSKLRIESFGDHLELTPISNESANGLIEKNGLLVVPATGNPCDAMDAISASREDREADLVG